MVTQNTEAVPTAATGEKLESFTGKKSRLIDLGSVEVETRGTAGGASDSPSPGRSP